MKLSRTVALILALTSFFACSTSKHSTDKNKNETVLGHIGDDPIYVSDFRYTYEKNNSDIKEPYSEESLKEYMDLYTNFRLKIKEAESRGLDTLKSFKQELNSYKKQLAEPFLKEEKVVEKLVKEAYDRMDTEVKVSHILIKVPENASPEDTLEAYKKIKEIKQKAVSGEKDFNQLAREHSEDPSAKKNNGKLGYFTAFQMVYPFENAAYNTPEGEVSNIVRTKYGYHILKVHDKREARGKVKTAHIMIRANPGMSKKDSIKARERIQEVYEKAKEGADWKQLVRKYSEDPKTRRKGGQLPWFSTGKMIPSFANVAFSLDSTGDISKPFKTAYGWHIVKLIDKKKPTHEQKSFDELKDKLKKKVKNSKRSDKAKTALINRLKKENNFKEYSSNKKIAWKHADSSLLSGEWSYNAQGKKFNKKLFTINDSAYLIKDFFKYLISNQNPGYQTEPAFFMKTKYKDFAEEKLLEYERNHLAEKYPDKYGKLVEEYRNGILLFQIMDEEVWSKAMEDTSGLKNYFEQNRENYQWEERAEAIIFRTSGKGNASLIKKLLKADSTVTHIKAEFKNRDASLNVNAGKFEQGEKEVIDEVNWEPGIYTLQKENKDYVIRINKIHGPRRKTFKEAKGHVISDYQDYLEKQWLKELRAKYPVEVKESVLEKITKN